MSVSISGENDLRKVSAGGNEDSSDNNNNKVRWNFRVSSDSPEVNLSFSVTTGPNADEAPLWTVLLRDSTNSELWSNERSRSDVTIDVPGSSPKELVLEVNCPTGARYGDTVCTEVTASSNGESDTMSFEAIAQQSIMILKTQIDQEVTVARELTSKEEKNKGSKDIYAILSPAGLRGYVFVEGMNTDRLREKTRDIKKARSFIGGETDIEEISPYLTPMSAVVGIVEGDIVELVNGPFKGEKARVQQIDQAKEEITVELIEAMVPIPVTVKGDSVRVIEKEK